jgi:hypothetical protein
MSRGTSGYLGVEKQRADIFMVDGHRKNRLGTLAYWMRLLWKSTFFK